MRRLAALLCPALLLLAGLPCVAADSPAPAKPEPIQAKAPIKNFTLPRFQPNGQRAMLLHGEEARLVSKEEIALKGMQLSIFDEKKPDRVETLLQAAAATFFVTRKLATGDEGVRLVHDEAQMSGTRWSYDWNYDVNSARKAKKVVIEGNVRVIFQSQIGDILK